MEWEVEGNRKMRGRLKKKKREVGPKGARGRREERKQILDLPSRDTPWKESLMPEFRLTL